MGSGVSRVWVKYGLISIVLIALLGSGWVYLNPVASKETVKVGVLHSLTGTMSISEKAVVHATLLAIEELNQAGGVLGRQIEAIVVDGASDWPTFGREAERLITEEKVRVVFGCWTSASRKTVKPVFEKHKHLLFYPVQYEGLEQSPNIVYLGAAPNQQIIPAVKWCSDTFGKKLFLVGSDYIFPRCANEIIKDQARLLGAEVVGEEYILLGSDEVADVVQKIRELQPDVVLNTINGDTNIHFFKALRAAGVTSEKTPSMSFSIAESALKEMGSSDMAGDYASWNYFQSIESEVNRAFVSRFRKKYGSGRVISDPMEAAYSGVHIWAKAVALAGTDDPTEVRKAVKGMDFSAPEGRVQVDRSNNHSWKTVRIGKIRPDGQFDIVWSSGRAVRPVPFPISRRKRQWRSLVDDLNEGWGGGWSSPGN